MFAVLQPLMIISTAFTGSAHFELKIIEIDAEKTLENVN